MRLTEYGKLVRKARIDAGITMLKMADSMGVSPSYLSATEVGKKKVSLPFARRVKEFFLDLGIDLHDLEEAAEVSNGNVSIKGLPPAQKFLVFGIARTEMTASQIDELSEMLSKIKKGGV